MIESNMDNSVGVAQKQKFNVAPSIKDAIIWTMAAIRAVSAITIINCWRKTEILPASIAADLDTGLNRGGTRERPSASVEDAVIFDLSEMLTKLSTALAIDKDHPIRLLSAEELLSLPGEKVVEAMPWVTTTHGEKREEQQHDDITHHDEECVIVEEETSSVDDNPPPRAPSLPEARAHAVALQNFLSQNVDFLPNGPRSGKELASSMDDVVYQLERMLVTARTQQTSLTQWFERTSTRPPLQPMP